MSEEKKAARSLAGIAGIVAVATLISKVFGLVRQVAIAAAFGVGPAFDAYNYAYVIPGFLPILLGGINGPFHSAIVSVLAKREKEETAPLVFADPLMTLVAPGLNITEAQALAEGMTPENFPALQIAN